MTKFTQLLDQDDGDNVIGWIINERLINMPPQVALPAFRMLMEEVQWAVEGGEPFDFQYFIIRNHLRHDVST